MRLRVGIDVGGTFTDVVLYDDDNKKVEKTFKLATESGTLVDNLINSIRSTLAVDEHHITILHGTTIGLNTLLQERGAKAALVTTKGFRDVYELGRQWRGQDVYNLFARPPKPLVPRHRIVEVDERIGSKGETVAPLSESEVARVVDRLRELDVESVAVCFLFSFLNPEHERRVGMALKEALPHVSVSLSCEVVPEFREYERTSTVVIDAYIKPTVSSYLSQLEQQVGTLGGQPRTYIMRSGGGLATLREAEQIPVQSMFSGPVAGVLGASHLGKTLSWPKIITLDMGGTSTDVALVLDGQPLLSKDREIAGRPLNTPTVEVNSIGSGGGSLASLLAGKVIRVGPESAGADPGPACYGRGGTEPTLTDAWLVAGHLSENLIDSELSLDRAAATKAIEERIAQPLGIGAVEAAWDIINVATAQSYELLRLITVKRGYDPREFNLVTFGGAGPVYASALARDLGIPRVCIPSHPGIFSAFGFLSTDLVQDYAETRIADISEIAPHEIQNIWARLEEAAMVARPGAKLQRSIDLRYKGQAYEVMVDAPEGEWSQVSAEAVCQDFHKAHEQRYGLSAEGAPVEYVVFRVRSRVPFPRPQLKAEEATYHKPIPFEERPAFFDGRKYDSVKVFRRDCLLPGHSGEGPLIITEFGTTTVVYPKQRFEIDIYNNIVITN